MVQLRSMQVQQQNFPNNIIKNPQNFSIVLSKFIMIQKQQPSYFGSPLQRIKKKNMLITIPNQRIETHKQQSTKREIRKSSHLKLTGDMAMVLFSSNVMIPLTLGSLLLVLKQPKQQNFQFNFKLRKKTKKKTKNKTQKYAYLYSIFPVVGSNITHRSFHFLNC